MWVNILTCALFTWDLQHRQVQLFRQSSGFGHSVIGLKHRRTVCRCTTPGICNAQFYFYMSELPTLPKKKKSSSVYIKLFCLSMFFLSPAKKLCNKGMVDVVYHRFVSFKILKHFEVHSFFFFLQYTERKFEILLNTFLLQQCRSLVAIILL